MPSRQTGKGSVPPTGTLLQDLLGQSDPSVDRQREQNLEALRQRSERGLAGARRRRGRRSTTCWG